MLPQNNAAAGREKGLLFRRVSHAAEEQLELPAPIMAWPPHVTPIQAIPCQITAAHLLSRYIILNVNSGMLLIIQTI